MKIAAINCAQQDCGEYDIEGTPTVRVFGPRYSGPNKNETLSIGRDVVPRHELEYWYETILAEIETEQQNSEEERKKTGGLTLVDLGLPNLMAYEYDASITTFILMIHTHFQ